MNDIGYLYVISDGNKSKIGKSKTPEKRIKTLIDTCGISDPQFFVSSECSDMSKKENECHHHFKDLNVHSEWFSVSFDSAVDFVSLAVGSECLKIKKEQDKAYLIKRNIEIKEFTDGLIKGCAKEKNCTDDNFNVVFKDTIMLIDICEDSTLIDSMMNVNDSLDKLLIVRCMALQDVLRQSQDAISYYQKQDADRLKLGFS